MLWILHLVCLLTVGCVAHLVADTALLQQVLFHAGPLDGPVLVEGELQVLPEAAGVVVADGFSVPKGWMRKEAAMMSSSE